jgi:hypothetical protein
MEKLWTVDVGCQVDGSAQLLREIAQERARQRSLEKPHPSPTAIASSVAQTASDASLGRLQTSCVPASQIERWSVQPPPTQTGAAYDFRRPIRELHERVRAHTIEQGRLDELGRLKARAQQIGEAGGLHDDAPTHAHQRVLKQKALVSLLQNEWPSIVGDLSEASRNGLKEAAHAGAKGWRVDDARAWADNKGKLKDGRIATPLATPWVGGTTTHKLPR